MPVPVIGYSGWKMEKIVIGSHHLFIIKININKKIVMIILS